MRAVAIEQFGETARLLDLPKPIPAPGQVLVRMQAAAVNPVDAHVADGALQGRFQHSFPLTLGFDGAGEVEALGDGVDRFAIGDAVFGQLWSDPIGRGSFAEWAAVSEVMENGALAPLPPGVAPEIAAALPTAGLTAFGAVESLEPATGTTLLILGATGGVGSFAVQLAAGRGAHVIASARADADTRIRGLGAAETIDYSGGELPRLLAAAHPDGVDAVLDLTGDGRLLAACASQVKDGGRATSIAFAVGEEMLADTRIMATNYANQDKPRLLAGIGGEVAAGRVTVEIEREIGLAEVPEALGRSSGSRGKTVVRI
ncbi:MAG: NADP-dependent oxidoreductase [Actinobacteria bacterium]|nr:NADP-dependent oxidoreductase [Actinomycetota bacterium]